MLTESSSCARQQCHEDHPRGGRDDDPDGAQQGLHLPGERARCTAQRTSQQTGESRRAGGCDGDGHQAEGHRDFTGVSCGLTLCVCVSMLRVCMCVCMSVLCMCVSVVQAHMELVAPPALAFWLLRFQMLGTISGFTV